MVQGSEMIFKLTAIPFQQVFPATTTKTITVVKLK